MNDLVTLMFTVPLAHWGILLGGTVFFFVLGWFWYSPMTPTGKVWGTHFPMPKTMPSGSHFILMMIVQILMSFIITHTVMAFWLFATSNGLSEAVATFFMVKIFMGFVFIKDIGHWFFEKRPFSLVLIGTGYYLVGVLGACWLLAYFL